jgi:cyclopropane fatty-acyl-phospholipid synthase-like methyltransferase
MFRHIAMHIGQLPGAAPHVLELGCGPGALAEVLLDALPAITYEGVDLSGPMLELARERLARFGSRARLARADLNAAQWTRGIRLPVDAVVTNQALHDLGSDEAVTATYLRVHALLPETGMLVNAELVIPADGSKPSKPGKLTVAAHLERLREAGFRDVRCDVDHGEYVCLVARK